MNKDINNIIAEYAQEYVLLSWIPFDELEWHPLTANVNACDLINNNFDKLKNINNLLTNPGAINIIEQRKLYNVENAWYYLLRNPALFTSDILAEQFEIFRNANIKIDLDCLSSNLSAVHLLESIMGANCDSKKIKINYTQLSKNSRAIHLIEKVHREQPHEICWRNLSKNHEAIHILKKNKNKIDWDELSRNTGAIDLLLKNKENINWESFVSNPNAAKYIEEMLENITVEDVERAKEEMTDYGALIQNKINTSYLCLNPHIKIMNFLRKHQWAIDWYHISSNPSIFESNKKYILDILNVL